MVIFEYSHVVDKIKSLYLQGSEISRQCQFYNGKYQNIPYMKRIGYSTEELIRIHLEEWFTIQVKCKKESSTWFVIDVDTKSHSLINKVLNVLLQWIPEEYIHIFFSGNKGYHVTLFFQEPISIKALDDLTKWIRSQLKMKLEFAPISKKREIKLPLGSNHITGSFCCYVDHSLNPVHDSFECLMTIVPIPKQYLNIIPKVSSHPSKETTPDFMLGLASLPDAEVLMEQGLLEKHTRHSATMKICIELRRIGKPKDEAIKFLWEWSLAQFEKGMTTTKPKEIYQDIVSIAKFVYNLNFVVHKAFHTGCLWISQEEYDFINSVKYKTDNPKRVLLALLVHGKRWNQADGTFFMGVKQIQEATSLKAQTIKRSLKVLRDQEKIDRVHRGNSYKKQANIYKIPFDITKADTGFLIEPTENSASWDDVLKFFSCDTPIEGELQTTV